MTQRESNGALNRKVPQRGYFGIGIFRSKTPANIGTLYRSAFIYGASFIFCIGARYRPQSSDTFNTPLHIPLYHYDDLDSMLTHIPYDCRVIGVELGGESVPLADFKHPQRAIYLLGAEDHGLPQAILERTHVQIQVESLVEHSMNVAVAGSIILYDRHLKGLKKD